MSPHVAELPLGLLQCIGEIVTLYKTTIFARIVCVLLMGFRPREYVEAESSPALLSQEPSVKWRRRTCESVLFDLAYPERGAFFLVLVQAG